MSKTERFAAFVHVDAVSGCHLWTGATSWGYGTFWMNGGVRRAHRVAWEWAHGPIPDGLVVDHLCRNRACVNVEHLEVVTQQVNARRRTDATHGPLERGCPHGHPASEMRLYVYAKATVRRCRICNRERAEVRRRAAGQAPQVPLAERDSCVHGHPWPAELKVVPHAVTGRPTPLCKACHRAKTLRQREARKQRETTH